MCQGVCVAFFNRLDLCHIMFISNIDIKYRRRNGMPLVSIAKNVSGRTRVHAHRSLVSIIFILVDITSFNDMSICLCWVITFSQANLKSEVESTLLITTTLFSLSSQTWSIFLLVHEKKTVIWSKYEWVHYYTATTHPP